VAYLPAAVSLLLLEALFMQISGVRLPLTWPRRLCLLRVFLCATPTITSFPLSKHTAPAFSGLHVYLQLTWEVGLPPCPVEFSSHRWFYKLSRSWLLGVCCCSCLLQLACYEGFPLPPSSALRAPCPLCYVSFLLLLLIIQLCFLFSLGGGQSFQEAMLIWPRVVYWSTTYRLVHLVVCVFPSHLDAGIWRWPGGPPGFSI
jgi:hypothetical protein